MVQVDDARGDGPVPVIAFNVADKDGEDVLIKDGGGHVPAFSLYTTV